MGESNINKEQKNKMIEISRQRWETYNKQINKVRDFCKWMEESNIKKEDNLYYLSKIPSHYFNAYDLLYRNNIIKKFMTDKVLNCYVYKIDDNVIKRIQHYLNKKIKKRNQYKKMIEILQVDNIKIPVSNELYSIYKNLLYKVRRIIND